MSLETSVRYIQYSFLAGPGTEEVRGGVCKMNCQAWVHWELSTLGVLLPTEMKSLEIYTDESVFFRTLLSGEPVRRGDVFLFGRTDLVDYRLLHLAIHSGYEKKQTREPILTHATYIDGTVTAWPLSWFSRQPRYGKLFAIKRPIG